MLKRILIANRGEIACRIARTCRRLGVEYVAIHSEPDAGAPHGQGAVANVPIGPGPAASSYLQVERIIAAAHETGCDAIHPGYGFLAENPGFAHAVIDAGLIFIGPDAEIIARMGDKAIAKRVMAGTAVPVIPGAAEATDDPTEVARLADETGFPAVLKPVAGGGGKGMTIVEEPGAVAAAAEMAIRLARANFGDGHLLIERYIPHPRHIEVQVFGDRYGNIVHLFERECSLQRRHQKVVEEAPAPGLAAALRQAMLDAALRGARAIGYVNAGTFEFIVDPNGLFYFLEANTRLQVEHSVTEAVTGLDLVELQLRVAAGERLPMSQEEIDCRGHAVEARVYAEDPRAGFRPSPGHALAIAWPSTLRVDAALLHEGDVPPFYDPLLAKLIGWAGDRGRALAMLQDGIARSRVAGLTTNLGFLARLLAHPDVVAGRLDTQLIDRASATLLGPDVVPAAAAAAAAIERSAALRAAPLSPWNGPMGILDRRFLDPEAPLGRTVYSHDGTSIEVRFGDATRQGLLVHVAGEAHEVTAQFDGTWWHGGVGERPWCALAAAGRLEFMVGGDRVVIENAAAAEQVAPEAGEAALAPMPGVIVVVAVAVGDRVAKGAVLAVVEAMKMENQVLAPLAGVVREVRCREQETVMANQILVVVGRDETAEPG